MDPHSPFLIRTHACIIIIIIAKPLSTEVFSKSHQLELNYRYKIATLHSLQALAVGTILCVSVGGLCAIGIGTLLGVSNVSKFFYYEVWFLCETICKSLLFSIKIISKAVYITLY